MISASDTRHGMKAGADHFLDKPYGRRQLDEAIRHALVMRHAIQSEGDPQD